jgi:hypothetical protein
MTRHNANPVGALVSRNTFPQLMGYDYVTCVNKYSNEISFYLLYGAEVLSAAVNEVRLLTPVCNSD